MRTLELHQLDLKYRALRVASPAAEARLLSSLAHQGQTSPVLVVPVTASEPGAQYVLIDGYRRVRALGQLSHDTVDALVMAMSEGEALVWRHQWAASRSRTALEEAWLLCELRDQHDFRLAELARRMGHSESWISRRMAMVTVLPDAVQQMVRRGVLCPYVAQKYLVPLARANVEHCERLAAGLAGQQVKTRAMERLYAAWKAGTADQKQRIVDNPTLFLAVQAELAGDGRQRDRQRDYKVHMSTPASPDEELAFALDELARHSRQVVERLEPRTRDVALPSPVKRAWSRARSYLDPLKQDMEKRCYVG